MMGKGIFILILVLIIILALFGFFYIQRTTKVIAPAPSPTTQPSSTPATTTSYCTPEDLQASLSLSPAAGNIYGTFILKNISNQSCFILGGNFIEAGYPNSIQNISVTHQGQTQSQPFTLQPNQTLYSQVHYPNGPQCQGPTQEVKVSFSYKISPKDSITFKNQGNTNSIVQDCQGPKVTQIQIWQLSPQPITPQ